MIENKNIYLLGSLFLYNKEKRILKTNYLGERNLKSNTRYLKKILHKF